MTLITSKCQNNTLLPLLLMLLSVWVARKGKNNNSRVIVKMKLKFPRVIISHLGKLKAHLIKVRGMQIWHKDTKLSVILFKDLNGISHARIDTWIKVAVKLVVMTIIMRSVVRRKNVSLMQQLKRCRQDEQSGIRLKRRQRWQVQNISPNCLTKVTINNLSSFTKHKSYNNFNPTKSVPAR